MGPVPLDYAQPEDRRRQVPWWVALPVIAAMMGLFLQAVGLCGSRDSGARARIFAAKSDLAGLKDALDRFVLDTGRPPTDGEGLAALLSPPAGLAGWRGPYLRRVPADPWGNPYRYKATLSGYSVDSAGPDGARGTADDL